MENGWTNGVCAKSGAVGKDQASWIEATVTGPGTLTFRWKVLGKVNRGKDVAYAAVTVDGGAPRLVAADTVDALIRTLRTVQ